MGQSKSNFTEQELVAGIKCNDAIAFNYLYEHYAGALLRCIARMLPDESMAADILQNVLLKIYLKIASYDADKGRFFTWIFNIARNECLDVLRSKACRMGKRTIPLESRCYAERDNPYRKIDEMGVGTIFFSLSPDLRNLISLSFYYGFSHKEIAVLLDMPVGTVKTKMLRAYRCLKPLLQNQ